MEEFKIKKNIEFEDEETKIEFQKYLDKVNEYNKKVANGEKPDKDLSEIVSEFGKKFELDGYEQKEIDTTFDVEGLINKINNYLGVDSSSSDTDVMLENINSRIKELEDEENNN